MKKKYIPLLLIGLGVYQWYHSVPSNADSPAIITSSHHSQNSNTQSTLSQTFNNNTLNRAITNQQSDVQVKGTGVVIKILSDDTKGAQHQRFILRLSDNNTLLIAHNIDLSPKIKSLTKGDTVDFYGEYEWTKQGGVVHWTHKDPGKRHIDGWLKHNGKTYQ